MQSMARHGYFERIWPKFNFSENVVINPVNRFAPAAPTHNGPECIDFETDISC